MRRKQHIFITAGGAVGLIAAIYLIARSPQPPAEAAVEAPRPEPVAPVATTTPQTPLPEAPVSKPANNFRELHKCIAASEELARAKHLMDCSFYEGKPEYQKALAECLAGPMDSHNRKTAAEAALADCDQTDLGRRYFEAAKEAAKRGDTDAQLCYLQGYFYSPEGEQIFTDTEIVEYRKVAPGYVDAAFKRGDWRVVQLLNKRHFHPGGGPSYLLEGMGDRETQYTMTKLLRLGASGPLAKSLDADLHGMKHPDLIPSAALPEEITSEGDAWAQETYNNYFAGVPGITERPVICAD